MEFRPVAGHSRQKPTRALESHSICGSLYGYLGYSAAFAVNHLNQYAGWTQYGNGSTYRAFRYIGSMSALTPMSGFSHSYGYGIAGDGTVVGVSQNTGGSVQATKWLP